MIPTLLYSSEMWTLYRRHILYRRLDKVQQRHLRQLMNISWKDHISNFEVLERAEMPSVEEMVTACQLRLDRACHTLEDSRLPKAVFYGEFKEGSRRVGTPRLRFKDVFKRHLKNTNEYKDWRGNVNNRGTWRKVVAGAAGAIRRGNVQLWTNKRLRKLEPEPPPTEAAHKCETCNRTFKAAIGLSSHLRHGH